MIIHKHMRHVNGPINHLPRYLADWYKCGKQKETICHLNMCKSLAFFHSSSVYEESVGLYASIQVYLFTYIVYRFLENSQTKMRQ